MKFDILNADRNYPEKGGRKMIFRKITALLLTLVTACSVLCACGSERGNGGSGLVEDNPDEHVKLVWYIRSSEPQGFKEVMEKANEYV